MAENRQQYDRVSQMTDHSPVPVAQLVYESSTAHPLSSVIRALGYAGLLLVAIRFVALISSAVLVNTQLRTIPVVDRNLYTGIFIGSTVLLIGVSILQFIASLSAISLAAGCLKLLKAWAWAALISAAVVLSLNISMLLHSFANRYGVSQIVYTLAYYVEHAAGGFAVPIFTLFLLRSPACADAIGQRNWGRFNR